MSTKLHLFVTLLTLVNLLSESQLENFVVVSTTQPPSEDTEKIYNDRLESLKYRVSSIESKINATSSKTQKGPTDTSNSPPKNCREVHEQGHKNSGIYLIQPKFSKTPFPVLCNMESHGGGWTYFLNRFNGLQDFYLGWNDYKTGFGNVTSEFWLGLEKLHLLTGYEVNELLVELEDFKNVQAYAIYRTFIISGEKDGYAVDVLKDYTGTAGDGLTEEPGMKFTTKDRDQDTWAEGNCADWSYGAWWYKVCKEAQLTGKYMGEHYNSNDKWKGIYWERFTRGTHTLKKARMMVRPHRP